MDTLLFGLVVGFLLALILWFALRRRRGGRKGPQVTVHSSIDAIRSVGEMVVLKVFTKQIVTSRDHLFGDWGDKWLAWLLSPKKTAMVFEFVVDFRYDLRSKSFKAEYDGADGIDFTLPPAFYEIQMKDMQIYDERGSALVPILLPEWIGQVFGGKFSEKEKNQLIRAARSEAEGLARELVTSMIHEVRKSAEATLGTMVRGMGYTSARFQFSDMEPERRSIDISSIEESAAKALARTGS